MYGEFEDDSHDVSCKEIAARADTYRETQFENEIRRLNDELSTERSRIDFLERTGTTRVYAISGVWMHRVTEDAEVVKMPTLRAAIDEAMAAQAKQEEYP